MALLLLSEELQAVLVQVQGRGGGNRHLLQHTGTTIVQGSKFYRPGYGGEGIITNSPWKTRWVKRKFKNLKKLKRGEKKSVLWIRISMNSDPAKYERSDN